MGIDTGAQVRARASPAFYAGREKFWRGFCYTRRRAGPAVEPRPRRRSWTPLSAHAPPIRFACCRFSALWRWRRRSRSREAPRSIGFATRGAITFGYRDGAAPFSFDDRDGRVRGYSAELCAAVAAGIQQALKLPALKIVWQPVDAATRIDSVASGRADAECGTTTITLSRMERVDFSLPIFVDGGSALVRTGSKICEARRPERHADRRDARHDDGGGAGARR